MITLFVFLVSWLFGALMMTGYVSIADSGLEYVLIRPMPVRAEVLHNGRSYPARASLVSVSIARNF